MLRHGGQQRFLLPGLLCTGKICTTDVGRCAEASGRQAATFGPDATVGDHGRLAL